jgi:uncharacterized protein
MELQQFTDSYLEPTEAGSDNPWQTRSTPCPFLKDNVCSVYEDRPADCSRYPYLYEKDFVFRTLGMIEGTFTCPIVIRLIFLFNTIPFSSGAAGRPPLPAR